MDASKVVVDGAVARLDGSAACVRVGEATGGKEASGTSTPIGIRSSSPALRATSAMDIDRPNGAIEESGGGKSDSEAETIVLPGKDGVFSPSKLRRTKTIKHEDRSEDEDMADADADAGADADAEGETDGEIEMQRGGIGSGNGGVQVGNRNGNGTNGRDGDGDGENSDKASEPSATSSLGKRKRSNSTTTTTTTTVTTSTSTHKQQQQQQQQHHKHHKHDRTHHHGSKNITTAKEEAHYLHGNSSGLSSAPLSPVATARSKPPASDSSRSPSPHSHSHSATRRKAKSVDRVLPRQKQYRAGSGSGDEAEPRRFNRQRSSGVEHKQTRDKYAKNTESGLTSHKRNRSTSPHPSAHRRSISTQLPSKSAHGLGQKKKRVPSPLQSTEYHSDDSSDSGSSHPRSSRLRHSAAPTTGESAMSPAKMSSGKHSHKNRSGQTKLAQACAKRPPQLDSVKERFAEWPGDLNEGDNYENTPLHIASLNGDTNIVKFLLDQNCIVDPVNGARETPLHDAIDNGHLDVIKLLLVAGANPHRPNANGEDPYDLVPEDDTHAEEIRAAIAEAKKTTTNTRRLSEDNQMQDNTYDAPQGSPRQTTPNQNQDLAATSRRNASTTGRMVKTKASVLYQSFNVDELRRAVGNNDLPKVGNLLDVLGSSRDDPKSLIIAAKGGYYDIINVLLAVGQFNPDPQFFDGESPESCTPILAAIGRGNLEVLKLFLEGDGFNPTKLVRGETYFEIAKRRGGNHWEEEVKLLREAFNKYSETHKSSPKKTRSPKMRKDRQETDPNDESKRPARQSEKQASRAHKGTAGSPKTKNSDLEKSTSKRTADFEGKKTQVRSKKEERPTSPDLSDRDNTSLAPPKHAAHGKKHESDVAVASSENEAAIKPRRKLVSGKDLKGEREREVKKQRRSSIGSSSAGVPSKDKLSGKPRHTSPSVQRVSKLSNSQDRDSASEKPRSIKRDDSKDRLSAIRGESPGKRQRNSETPPRPSMDDRTGYDRSESPAKKRKVEGEPRSGPRKERASSSSPDHRPVSSKPISKKDGDKKDKLMSSSASKRTASPERVRNAPPNDEKKAGRSALQSSKAESAAKDGSVDSASVAKAKEERESRKRREKEEREKQVRREKEEQEKKEQAELERRVEQERLEKERLVEQSRQKLAREQVLQEEEATRQREEAERRERRRQEDADVQERQRKLLDQQEKQKKEDQDRRRAQMQEQQRAERELREKERLAKLPPLLRWLDSPNKPKDKEMANPELQEVVKPKSHEIASLFKKIRGVRYDTIRTEAFGQENAREQWMLNTHAAFLLGEKDLQLSRYTAWERIPLSEDAKWTIWRMENGYYSMSYPETFRKLLVKHFPEEGSPSDEVTQRARLLFFNLELFFVKVSDFMYVVHNFPHLRRLELEVDYTELQYAGKDGPHYKKDSGLESKASFKPKSKFYINGDFVRQARPTVSKTAAKPFPENRVPRRELIEVYPNDPDYERICREQGLEHLLLRSSANRDAFSQNALESHTHALANGITPPSSEKAKSIDGSPHLANGVPLAVDTVMEEAA